MEFDARDLTVFERAAKVAERIAELDAAIRRDGLTSRPSACTQCGVRPQGRLHPAAAELRQLEIRLLIQRTRVLARESQSAATGFDDRSTKAEAFSYADDRCEDDHHVEEAEYGLRCCQPKLARMGIPRWLR